MFGDNTRKDKWSRNELQVLLGYHKSGVASSALIETFNRTEQAINKMAIRMGVKLGAKNKKGDK